MRNIIVNYRQADDGAWIGTSDDAPGYVGHGLTLADAREQVQEGLPFFLDEDDVLIVHMVIVHMVSPRDGQSVGARIQFGITRQEVPRLAYSHRFVSAKS